RTGNVKISHAIGTRGTGDRYANASGASTGHRSLCSRIGLVLIPTRTRKRGTAFNPNPNA
ncbi:MAG: hypothetical protein ACK5T6_14855, partial [Pirellula sp.]